MEPFASRAFAAFGAQPVQRRVKAETPEWTTVIRHWTAAALEASQAKPGLIFSIKFPYGNKLEAFTDEVMADARSDISNPSASSSMATTTKTATETTAI